MKLRGLCVLTLAASVAATAGCRHPDEAASAGPPSGDSMPAPAPSTDDDRAQPPEDAPTVVFEPSGGAPAQVTVEIADTEPQIKRGLMYRSHLASDHGMLFVMPEEADHSFFMKNTIIPLDMIFISRDKEVLGIVADTEPRTLTSHTIGEDSLYIVEVNAGWAAEHGVERGTRVRFENVDQDREPSP